MRSEVVEVLKPPSEDAKDVLHLNERLTGRADGLVVGLLY